MEDGSLKGKSSISEGNEEYGCRSSLKDESDSSERKIKGLIFSVVLDISDSTLYKSFESCCAFPSLLVFSSLFSSVFSNCSVFLRHLLNASSSFLDKSSLVSSLF